MRLGLYECKIIDSTYTKKIYKSTNIKERHRHRYEVNNKYVKELANVGLISSGVHTEGDLVEIMEKNEIYSLAVLNSKNQLCGVIRMHDFLKANLI